MKKFVPVIAIIIIVCLSGQAWQPVLAGTWRDDFGGSIRAWKVYNFNPQIEKWWIDDGEAVGEIFEPGWMSLWLTGRLVWQYYSLSCQAKLTERGNEPPSIGLTLHDRGEEDSRYLFFIDYVFGTVRIVKALRDNWFPIIYSFDAEIDTWYEMTAAIHEDGTLEFKVDDEVFTAVDDDPLKGGQAGLVVADGQARFDNVEITGKNIRRKNIRRGSLYGDLLKTRPFAPRRSLTTAWGEFKRK